MERMEERMSIRLNGSLGCTWIGVSSSNHCCILPKSMRTSPARSAALPVKCSLKARTLSVELSSAWREYWVARAVPLSEANSSPGVRVKGTFLLLATSSDRGR